MLSKEKLYIEIGKLQAEFEELSKGNVDISSDDYLKMINLRYEISKKRNKIAKLELKEKKESGEFEHYSRKKSSDEIYELLKLHAEKELEIAKSLYEESGFRWALKRAEGSSLNNYSTIVSDDVMNEVVTKLALQGIIITVGEKNPNKKQYLKSSMLKCNSRISELKKEIFSIDRVLENLLVSEELLEDIKEIKMR